MSEQTAVTAPDALPPAAAAPRAAQPLCERCDVYEERRGTLATRYQEYRGENDPPQWANTQTLRCERCAQALREYAALGGISTVIVVDEPLDAAPQES